MYRSAVYRPAAGEYGKVNIDASLAHRIGRLIAIGRTGVGLVALTAPSLPLRPWIGSRRDDAGALALGRALGGRDLALGMGVLMSGRHDRPIRGWVEAGGLADAADAVATLIAFRELPRAGRWVILSAAASSAAAALVSARRMEAG